MATRNSSSFLIPADINSSTLPSFEEYASTYEWVEWVSKKHLRLTAHAVNPSNDTSTGVRRSVNGAVIPSIAVEAGRLTQRDPFSVNIIEGRYAALVRKAKMNDAIIERTDAKQRRKEEVRNVVSKRTQEKQERKNAKIEVKSPAVKKPEKRIEEFMGGELHHFDNRIEVHVNGLFKRVLEKPKSGKLELRVSSKSWQVLDLNEASKRVAFGRL